MIRVHIKTGSGQTIRLKDLPDADLSEVLFQCLSVKASALAWEGEERVGHVLRGRDGHWYLWSTDQSERTT